MKKYIWLAALFAGTACVEAAPPGPDAMPGEDVKAPDAGGAAETAYERLGARNGTRQIARSFADRLSRDPKINGYFLNSSVSIDHFVLCFAKQLGAITGGPEVYPKPEGAPDADGCRNMKRVHDRLGISRADYRDFMTALVGTFRDHGMSSEDIETITGALDVFEPEIIENPTDSESVYLRAGRKPAFADVARDFTARVVADPKINGYFLNDQLDVDRLTICLTRQLCQISGGPCKYGEESGAELITRTCRPMRGVHAGLGISRTDFDDLAGHLVAALTASTALSRQDVDGVVALVASLRDEIVEDRRNDLTIYQRAGRKPGLQRVVDTFLGRVVADPKINGYFLNDTLNAGRLGTCLVRQLCSASGGPCSYGHELGAELFDGIPCRPMLESHQGLNISPQDFSDLAEHFAAALEVAGEVSAEDAAAIMAVLAPLEAEIAGAPQGDETIYHRIGRRPGIEQVIDDFLARAVADPKINGYFLNSSLDGARLRTCLVRQVCEVAGGPCRYGHEAGGDLFDERQCRPMTDAHAGLGISAADFDDLADHLTRSLIETSGLESTDIGTTLRAITRLREQIVTDAQNNATIYQRAGRKVELQAITGDFLMRVVADPSLAGFFANTNPARLETCLTRQLCAASGGPCGYGLEAGSELFDDTPCRDMTAVHAEATNGSGVPISRADFDALVGHLVDAMVDSGSVSTEDRGAIVDALAPLCPQIVRGGVGC